MLFPESIGFLEAFDKAQTCDSMDSWVRKHNHWNKLGKVKYNALFE